MDPSGKETLTFEIIIQKLFSGDFVFDNYVISEATYPKMDQKLDILHFRDLLEMVIGDGPKLRENKVDLEFRNCIFNVAVGFSLNKNMSFKRFFNCEFKYACSFIDVDLDFKRNEPEETFVNFIGFFDKVTFKDLYFHDVKIKTPYLFKDVSINGDLVFDNCTIVPAVVLTDLPIEGNVTVLGCEFMDVCRIEIPFKKNLNIYSKKLEDKTEKPTIFHNTLALRGEFYGQLLLQNVLFKKDFLFQPIYVSDKNLIFNSIKIEGSANFRNLNFSDRAQFRKIDLSKSSFLYSKFDDALFSECEYINNKIYDELMLNTGKINYKDVYNELRMFEMSFDKRKNFEQAGKFHYDALELLRKNENNIFRKSLLWFYKISSNYGEGYGISLIWIIIVILLFSIFYLYTGISYAGYNIWWWDCSKPFSINDWGSSLLYSLISSSPIKKDSEVVKSLGGWTTALSIIQTIIQTTLVTLFIIGIRRKFKR